jgi:hypothetical protein
MTIALAYIIRGGRDKRVYAEELVTDGIYGHCRNPMYVGNLLLITGVAITSNAWWCVGIAVPVFTFLYAAIIAAEERYLAAKFGPAFAAYCCRVPSLVPRLAGVGSTVSEMEFHWRRLLVKEYGTVFGWGSRWVLVVAFNLWRLDALRPGTPPVQTLILVFALVTLFWLSIKTLKRLRLIVAD